MANTARLEYEIVGVDAEIGSLMSMADWAEWASGDGAQLPSPAVIQRAVGLTSKSWDTERFKDLGVARDSASRAMEMAGVDPSEIDAAIIVTCTPYQILLDQDSFQLLRELRIPDTVAPIQVGAGCAGLARAMTLLASMTARCALVLTYNLVSGMALSDEAVALYRSNAAHPLGRHMWVSPALFSDGAAALVLRRTPEVTGFSLYSRDSHSFGDEPAFTDPIIHYPGGGVAYPPGSRDAAELSCYGISLGAVKEYYTKGMMLNHEALTKERPGYVEEVRRIYTHQASPALVDAFAKLAALPADKAPTNARRLGNLVSASTAQMLHDDVQQGIVGPGDEVCLSVVGAGPERGAFILPIAASVA